MPVTRWLWSEQQLAARLVRTALIPASLAYRAVSATRVGAYRKGLLRCRALPAPSVAVGNLTVGGSGKTPVASWIAGYYSRRGLRPGILLRGYGGDEGDVHRQLVPEAVVVENPDRIRGARDAIADGAEILVLDDAYQRIDVARDLNVAVVSAEPLNKVPRILPAGPWREGWQALNRADLVIVTRKHANSSLADTARKRVVRFLRNDTVAIAHLGIAGFRGMFSDVRLGTDEIRGARAVVATGIGDPDSLAAQCRSLGASVAVMCWEDHHAFTRKDVDRIIRAGKTADRIVTTEKDAGKLRTIWPRDESEPLVADLSLRWEGGADLITAALDSVAAPIGR